MKKNSKKSLLRLQKFTIANLNNKNKIKGGDVYTDEDRVTLFRTTCFQCLDDDSKVL